MNDGTAFRNPSYSPPAAFDDSTVIRQPLQRGTAPVTYKDVYDTSDVDMHRQGVELTRETFRRRGSFKIHSGEVGHALSPLTIGVGRNAHSPNIFIDNVIDSPIAILTSGIPIEPSINHAYKFDETQQNHYGAVYNGIIEPLSIRRVITLIDIEMSQLAHATRGTLMSGNENRTFGSDIVTGMFVYGITNINAYHDDIIESLAAGVSVSHDAKNVIGVTPFDDRHAASDFLDYDAEDDMYQHMTSRLSGDPGYVPPNSYVARTGFVYGLDRNVIDSVAFGGLTY